MEFLMVDKADDGTDDCSGIRRIDPSWDEGKIYHSRRGITRLQPEGWRRDEASKMKVRCENGVKGEDGI
jgi:hypothetical protein